MRSKNRAPSNATPAGTHGPIGGERSTRARIARLILENGPVSAAALSTRLGLTPAAVRRHLDGLLVGGMIEVRSARRPASRGYDDLATGALRFLAEVAGPDAVAEFARRQVAELERRYRPVMASADPDAKVKALAGALSADGYAASTTGAPASSPVPPTAHGPALTVLAGGEQLCQHHCPVAHVAAEFPQLCEAETEAFGRLLGTPVQRLATIAHGDGICTTHVTDQSLVQTRTTTTSTNTTTNTNESGGISA